MPGGPVDGSGNSGLGPRAGGLWAHHRVGEAGRRREELLQLQKERVGGAGGVNPNPNPASWGAAGLLIWTKGLLHSAPFQAGSLVREESDLGRKYAGQVTSGANKCSWMFLRCTG